MWMPVLPQLLFIGQSLSSPFHYGYFEILMQQFLLLGIVPGTNIQLTLNDIVLVASYVGLGFIFYKLCQLALRFIDLIDPDKDLPPGIRRIDLLAL